jgi:beta-lactam-binding protein with PASTA domain
VSVANLRGLSEAAAASKLTALGLKANVFRVPASQAAGTVIAQAPAPDARVQKGTAVRINVSKGVTQTSTTTVVTPTVTTSTTTTQATTTTATTTATSTGTTATTSTTTGTSTGAAASPPAKKVSVPDVTGQNEQSAASQLASAGLLADSYPVSSNETGGTVLAEKPASGTLPSGSVVRLNVAIGSGPRAEKTIPSVKSLDEKTARSRLRASGLTVRAVYRTTKNKAFEKKVIFQTPGAGDHARAYFQVTIYVGRLAGSATGTTTASTP